MEEVCSGYISALMTYIEMEYDNLPSQVTPEMERYFMECFNDGDVVCLPNAAGGFWERFLRTQETL